MPPKKTFNIGATSVMKEGSLARWLEAPITSDLSIVPGIGPANKKLIEAEGITNTFQLFGKFLLLKADGLSSQGHMDATYEWLASLKVNSQRAVICLALAEKASILMPNVFNREELDPPAGASMDDE